MSKLTPKQSEERIVLEFRPGGFSAVIPRGGSISEAAALAGLRLPSDCGGAGSCGRCLVRPDGLVSPPDGAERQVLERVKAEPGLRLACRTRAMASQTVQIHQDGSDDVWRVMDHAGVVGRTNPAVRRVSVVAEPPSIHDQRADLSRATADIPTPPGGGPWRCGPAALARLSTLARKADWRFDALTHGSEIIGAVTTGGSLLGLAVDLGTTKLAAYLMDMDSGQLLGSQGLLNPQAPWGADLISRLNSAMQGPEQAQRLAEAARQGVNQLAGELLAGAGADAQHLADICLVGNTAMIQLMLGLPPRQLAVSPFVCSADGPQDIRAAELGLDAAPGAWVHVPPGIGGFVGADHVSMIVGAGLDQEQGLRLGMDIGTNTEIVLYIPGAATPLLVASAPSGPAFEAAHLSCGMHAVSGAVGKVWVQDQTLAWSTVDGAPPAGLCGSGVIDLIATLHCLGIIDDRGHLDREAPGVRGEGGGAEFVVASADKTATGRALALSQDDIVQVQMAKAAIMAGVAILLETAGVDAQDLDQVILAGSFGSHFDVATAMDIGMLPRLAPERFHQVGNAAGLGAQMILGDVGQRARAATVPGMARYIELTVKPEFGSLMARSLVLPSVS